MLHDETILSDEKAWRLVNKVVIVDHIMVSIKSLTERKAQMGVCL